MEARGGRATEEVGEAESAQVQNGAKQGEEKEGGCGRSGRVVRECRVTNTAPAPGQAPARNSASSYPTVVQSSSRSREDLRL